MTTENTNSERKFRVVVAAIVGGRFDVAKGAILTSKELGEWEEPFLKDGAIELLEEEELPQK